MIDSYGCDHYNSNKMLNLNSDEQQVNDLNGTFFSEYSIETSPKIMFIQTVGKYTKCSDKNKITSLNYLNPIKYTYSSCLVEYLGKTMLFSILKM